MQNQKPVVKFSAAVAPAASPVFQRFQQGKAGWILLWLLGIPLPILLILYLLRGCT